MDEEIKEIKIEKTVAETPKPQEVKSPRLLKVPKVLKVLGITLGILGVVGVVLGVIVGIPLFKAYNDGRTFYKSALAIKDAAKSQDIAKTREAVLVAQKQLAVVSGDVSSLGWTKIIPFVGGYSSDMFALLDSGKDGLEAAKVTTEAIEPYADLLGLKGQGTFTGGTTEERIAKVVETLDKITPQIDGIAVKVTGIRKSLDKVDPKRYPTNFRGKNIREQVLLAKQSVVLMDDLMTQARPMVKQLPILLGSQGEKKYLVLFQNDKELRPTGGFITAYAIFRIEKGKISLNASDDIYKLDAQMKKHVTPPTPISKYLNVYGWRMRDANFSPDFYASMKTFEDLYATTGSKEKFDGIIAMDTHVLVSLMNVLGPVSIYGTNFTTEKVSQCNCPMVIWELEKYADEPTYYERGNRKDIIGIMLQALMKKVMTGSKAVYGPLFQAGLNEAMEKHILVYLKNEDAQKGVEALNFAGRIKTSDGDYLHINDANLGGAKSNLYISPKATQEVNITDSGADETLTIEYRYPQKADNCSLERKSGLCLAGIYRDYLRIYLPKGATILETKGFENKSTTFEDLGHTVADGFFTVVPEGLARITIKYRVVGSFKKSGIYNSLIQKQPGTVGIPYKIVINGKPSEFNLTQDKELSVKL